MDPFREAALRVSMPTKPAPRSPGATAQATTATSKQGATNQVLMRPITSYKTRETIAQTTYCPTVLATSKNFLPAKMRPTERHLTPLWAAATEAKQKRIEAQRAALSATLPAPEPGALVLHDALQIVAPPQQAVALTRTLDLFTGPLSVLDAPSLLGYWQVKFVSKTGQGQGMVKLRSPLAGNVPENATPLYWRTQRFQKAKARPSYHQIVDAIKYEAEVYHLRLLYLLYLDEEFQSYVLLTPKTVEHCRQWVFTAVVEAAEETQLLRNARKLQIDGQVLEERDAAEALMPPGQLALRNDIHAILSRLEADLQSNAPDDWYRRLLGLADPPAVLRPKKSAVDGGGGRPVPPLKEDRPPVDIFRSHLNRQAADDVPFVTYVDVRQRVGKQYRQMLDEQRAVLAEESVHRSILADEERLASTFLLCFARHHAEEAALLSAQEARTRQLLAHGSQTKTHMLRLISEVSLHALTLEANKEKHPTVVHRGREQSIGGRTPDLNESIHTVVAVEEGCLVNDPPQRREPLSCHIVTITCKLKEDLVYPKVTPSVIRKVEEHTQTEPQPEPSPFPTSDTHPCCAPASLRSERCAPSVRTADSPVPELSVPISGFSLNLSLPTDSSQITPLRAPSGPSESGSQRSYALTSLAITLSSDHCHLFASDRSPLYTALLADIAECLHLPMKRVEVVFDDSSEAKGVVYVLVEHSGHRADEEMEDIIANYSFPHFSSLCQAYAEEREDSSEPTGPSETPCTEDELGSVAAPLTAEKCSQHSSEEEEKGHSHDSHSFASSNMEVVESMEPMEPEEPSASSDGCHEPSPFPVIPEREESKRSLNQEVPTSYLAFTTMRKATAHMQPLSSYQEHFISMAAEPAPTLAQGVEECDRCPPPVPEVRPSISQCESLTEEEMQELCQCPVVAITHHRRAFPPGNEWHLVYDSNPESLTQEFIHDVADVTACHPRCVRNVSVRDGGKEFMFDFVHRADLALETINTLIKDHPFPRLMEFYQYRRFLPVGREGSAAEAIQTEGATASDEVAPPNDTGTPPRSGVLHVLEDVSVEGFHTSDIAESSRSMKLRASTTMDIFERSEEDLNVFDDDVPLDGYTLTCSIADFHCIHPTLDSMPNIRERCLVGEPVVSHHSVRQDGEGWEAIVGECPLFLRERFVAEAAEVLRCPISCIRNVTFRANEQRLRVDTDIVHDETRCRYEIQRALREHVFEVFQEVSKLRLELPQLHLDEGRSAAMHLWGSQACVEAPLTVVHHPKPPLSRRRNSKEAVRPASASSEYNLLSSASARRTSTGSRIPLTGYQSRFSGAHLSAEADGFAPHQSADDDRSTNGSGSSTPPWRVGTALSPSNANEGVACNSRQNIRLNCVADSAAAPSFLPPSPSLRLSEVASTNPTPHPPLSSRSSQEMPRYDHHHLANGFHSGNSSARTPWTGSEAEVREVPDGC